MIRINARSSRRQRGCRRGFTLIEVLAAMLLLAIVLPAAMQGISLATRLGATAAMRTQAAGLAQEKLNEIIADNDWTNGNSSGDFPDWPAYRWQSAVQDWAQDNTNAGLQQIDVTVSWQNGAHQDSLTVSTITYQRTTQ